MRRWLVAALASAHLVAAERAGAVVIAWRNGATLHFSNDAADVPQGATVRRFEARVPVSAVPTTAPAEGHRPHTAYPAAVAVSSQCPGTPYPRLRGEHPYGAIIVAPTIVVRAPWSPTVTVARSWPAQRLGPFLPSGFIGHEHPQVGFLAGRRLVSHSHFFPRGRSGWFTPWGHFSSHGLLRENVPSY